MPAFYQIFQEAIFTRLLLSVQLLRLEFSSQPLTELKDLWHFWTPGRCKDSGFQIIQSYLAFANGHVFGQGIGNSNEKLFYLPEAHNDFILSVIGEELGFVGVLPW